MRDIKRKGLKRDIADRKDRFREAAGSHVYQGIPQRDGGGLWKQSTSLYGCSARRNWRKSSFTWVPKGHGKDGLESGLSTGDPFGDDTDECDLWGNLSAKTSFVYQEIFFTGNAGRYVAEGSGKGRLSP
jgi:hypothetical protein